MCGGDANINNLIEHNHHISLARKSIHDFRKRIIVTFRRMNTELQD